MGGDRKIIASDNPDFSLPRIPDDYRKTFECVGRVCHVSIEVFFPDGLWSPMVNKDGIIIITKLNEIR
jgi:hypothetical protein